MESGIIKSNKEITKNEQFKNVRMDEETVWRKQ